MSNFFLNFTKNIKHNSIKASENRTPLPPRQRSNYKKSRKQTSPGTSSNKIILA